MAQAKLVIILPALGIAQIVSWGSLFYSIAVLAQPIGAELHLSRVQVFAGFSIALAISGLLSPWVGRAIDARDGRFILCRGALVGAAALAILSVADRYAIFLAGWCVAGVAMSMWLALLVLSGSLVLSLGKRRHEARIKGMVATEHRPTLAVYATGLADQLILITAVLCVMSFIFHLGSAAVWRQLLARSQSARVYAPQIIEPRALAGIDRETRAAATRDVRGAEQ